MSPLSQPAGHPCLPPVRSMTTTRVVRPNAPEDAVSLYSIILFLHIVGALGLFAGISLEQAGLRGLRRASTTGALREWLTVLNARRRIEGAAGVILLTTGAYMAATNWGRQPWIGLSLLGLVLIAVLGGRVTGRAVRGLLSALPADDRPVSPALRQRLDSAAPHTSASLRAALALGVVFDMAVKPQAPGAVLALVAASIVGALAPRLGSREALASRQYGAEH